MFIETSQTKLLAPAERHIEYQLVKIKRRLRNETQHNII